MLPSEDGLEPGLQYSYKVFPIKFRANLFNQPRKTHDYTESVVYKSVVTNEMIMNMHDLDWARYMCESVYCLWIQVLCGVIPNYKQHAAELISFTRKLLAAVQHKLNPMRETEIMYRRLFEACGNCGLSDQIKEMYSELQTQKNLEMDKITYSTYYESLMKCKEIEALQ